MLVSVCPQEGKGGGGTEDNALPPSLIIDPASLQCQDGFDGPAYDSPG